MTLLPLKKFHVDHVAEKDNCHVLRIKSFGVEFISNPIRAYNTRPFEIVVDEHGVIHNYNSQVTVSVDNTAKRTININTISIHVC